MPPIDIKEEHQEKDAKYQRSSTADQILNYKLSQSDKLKRQAEN